MELEEKEEYRPKPKENKENKKTNIIRAKQLSDDELSKVAGGSGGEGTRTIGNYHFSGHVNQYSAVVGTTYYICVDGKDGFGCGILVKSYERPDYLDLGFTKIKTGTTRVHVFNDVWGCMIGINFIEEALISDPNGVYAFKGSDVTLYTNRWKD